MICTPHPRRARGPRGGFTLAEMLVVLVIMGLMAAMAGPRMSRWFQSLASRGASNQVAADLMLARTHAVREGRTVSFRVESATLYLVTLDNTNGTAARELKRVDLSRMHPGTTVAPTGRIAFDSRGMLRESASTSGAVRVARGNAADTITVSGVGRIKRGS